MGRPALDPPQKPFQDVLGRAAGKPRLPPGGQPRRGPAENRDGGWAGLNGPLVPKGFPGGRVTLDLAEEGTESRGGRRRLWCPGLAGGEAGEGVPGGV